MELQSVGSLEVDLWGGQHDPTHAAVPRSTAGFPGTQLSAFAKSKQPLETGLCVCPCCLACGLSTSTDILSRGLGAQIGGQCPDLEPITCSQDGWEFSRESLLPFSSCKADPPRSSQELPPSCLCSSAGPEQGEAIWGEVWVPLGLCAQGTAGPTQLWGHEPPPDM